MRSGDIFRADFFPRDCQPNRQLMGCARTGAVCRQLMTVPGVGVLMALAFVTAVDDPTKFVKSRTLARTSA
jgi:transposase